jgi:hypothetical protein
VAAVAEIEEVAEGGRNGGRSRKCGRNGEQQGIGGRNVEKHWC